jgi:hypothetical protein
MYFIAESRPQKYTDRQWVFSLIVIIINKKVNTETGDASTFL